MEVGVVDGRGSGGVRVSSVIWSWILGHQTMTWSVADQINPAGGDRSVTTMFGFEFVFPSLSTRIRIRKGQ